MPTITLKDVEIYYERHGDDGEPLVLVHGYTGDISDWRHQLPEFARTHRVLIMDHRGHGRSHSPSEPSAYSILQMADDVEAVAEHAGFERFHLVGHSMGGMVSQEIAIRSAKKLLSLTLHDTGPHFDIGRNETVARLFEKRFELAREKGMAAVAELPGVPRPPHWPPERTEEEKRRMSQMSLHGFMGAWRAMCGWQGTRERAHMITSATMVIYGDLDQGVIEPMKWLAKTVAGAVEEVVPEAGHSPQYERPEIFNAALRRHLQRNATAAPK
jgi:pimeloyl-ACP methyl ester carboxylesterase